MIKYDFYSGAIQGAQESLYTPDTIMHFSDQALETMFQDFGLQLVDVVYDEKDTINWGEVNTEITKFIQQQMEYNFKNEGRPNKWVPLSPKWKAKKVGKTILTNTGEMRRSIGRGKGSFKVSGNNFEFVYSIPFSGSKYKYTVPLTGSKGKTTIYGASKYSATKKRYKKYETAKPLGQFTVPPRPWDYFDPTQVSRFIDKLVRMIVKERIILPLVTELKKAKK